MTRNSVKRLAAASISLAVLSLSLIATPALAGNTRSIYIGEPGQPIAYDANGNELNGSIINQTATHTGGKTLVNVEVRNDGGQTINHAILLGGDAADQAVVNCLFPPPGAVNCGQADYSAQHSLATGLTFAGVFSDEVTCPNWTSTSLSCDLGTLAAGQAKQLAIVFATAGSGPYPYWLGAYTAESNSTGSNQDNFYATGTITTADASCAANTDASYFLETDPISLSTADCGTTTGKVSSTVASGHRGTGLLSITDAVACPAAYPTCFGDVVQALIVDHTADSFTGGISWDVKWYGTNKVSGVIHYWDTYDPVTNPNDYTAIPFNKKNQCSAKLATNCWNTAVGSKNNASPLTFEATFVTPDNGKAGGFL